MNTAMGIVLLIAIVAAATAIPVVAEYVQARARRRERLAQWAVEREERHERMARWEAERPAREAEMWADIETKLNACRIKKES